MNAEEILTYLASSRNDAELRAVGKAAYDRLKDLDRIGDPAVLAKLRLAKKGSILKVAWRGKEPLEEVEFGEIRRGTITGMVRHLGRVYRFPVGWVKEVNPPDGKKTDLLVRSPRPRRRRGDGEDFD